MYFANERILAGVGSTELKELHASLLARVRNKQARVGIIGLGYVGLPLAHALPPPASRSSASTSTRPRWPSCSAARVTSATSGGR